MKYYSQYGQDQFLDRHIFKKKQNGFFVDIGAHDGITLSNSYFFEKERAWSGICVEPNPDVYIQLLANRKCIMHNLGIAKENGSFDYMKVEGYGQMLSGLVDQYDERHLNRIRRTAGERGETFSVVKIACRPLKDLLAEHQVSYVDYCSIDTEGSELMILESIDFSAVDFEVFTVENNYKMDDVKKFLQARGYRFMKRISCDEVFARKARWYYWFR